MNRKYSVLAIVLVIASAVAMHESISLAQSAKGIMPMAIAACAMAVIIGSVVSFGAASGSKGFMALALLISISAICVAMGIVLVSASPDAEPLAAAESSVPAVQESPLPSSESPAAAKEEPARIPSAPSLSIKAQELTDDEPVVRPVRGDVPSAPKIFSLIYPEQ